MSLSKDNLIAVCGAGPGGLGAALAFHNAGYTNVHIYESRENLSQKLEESYPVGINNRGRDGLTALFGRDVHVDEIGLKVDAWSIHVGKQEFNVARFESGQVYGTTRSAVVNLMLKEIESKNIHLHLGHQVLDSNLENRTITIKKPNGEEEILHPQHVVVADGYKSRVRASLSQQYPKLRFQQFPWNLTFRVLLSEPHIETKLDGGVHYIMNGVYVSKLLDGRWTVVTSTPDPNSFLNSHEATDANVKKLKKYLENKAPDALKFFKNDEEFRAYFTRKAFTGAVTLVSCLNVDNFAVLVGDAAHSPIPATGEGINSSLEDAKVLQECLMNKEIGFENYSNQRYQDVKALTTIAYSHVEGSAKGAFQEGVLLVLKAMKLLGPTKEDLLFGKPSVTISPYSKIVQSWAKQTQWLGGPPKLPF